jgi:hypothetical protein
MSETCHIFLQLNNCSFSICRDPFCSSSNPTLRMQRWVSGTGSSIRSVPIETCNGRLTVKTVVFGTIQFSKWESISVMQEACLIVGFSYVYRLHYSARQVRKKPTFLYVKKMYIFTRIKQILLLRKKASRWKWMFWSLFFFRRNRF